MPRRLLVVRQRIWLRGKGLILTPGFIPTSSDSVRPGDRVILRCPDGSTREATVQGTRHTLTENEVDLLLGEVTKDEVPIGTEVWSIGG
jgi:hypothetical protein